MSLHSQCRGDDPLRPSGRSILENPRAKPTTHALPDRPHPCQGPGEVAPRCGVWVAGGSLQLTRWPLVSTVAPRTSRPAGHGDCGGGGGPGRAVLGGALEPGGGSSRVSSPGPVPMPAPRARAPPHRQRDLTRHPSADRAGLQPGGRAHHRPQPGRARGGRGGQEAGRPRGQDHRCAARGPDRVRAAGARRGVGGARQGRDGSAPHAGDPAARARRPRGSRL